MDHLDEPIRIMVSRRSLITLHHLWGKEAVDQLVSSFVDELHHQIEVMKTTGDYAKVVAETDADLLRQAQAQQDEKERS